MRETNTFARLPFRHPAFMAPMAGFTDRSFRKVVKSCGAALVFAEFVSADGLVRGTGRTLDLLQFDETERPFGIQLFGSDPAIMADAAQIAASLNPDVIDLNFGCPVQKVVKKGAGAALLKDLDRLERIASAVVKAITLPVTAKIRSGWSAREIVVAEAVKRLEGAGIQAVTVHPRTRQMGYSGRADWQLIRQAKENAAIPIIGNGDIWSAEDALRMIEETGCDYVMIARGALRNPWIFRQIEDQMSGRPVFSPGPDDWLELIRNQIEWSVQEKGEIKTLKEIRKYLAHYLRGASGSRSIRAAIHLQESIQEVLFLLEAYYHGRHE